MRLRRATDHVDVWQTAGFHRILWTSDVLASSISLITIVLGFARLKSNLPEDHTVQDVYFGPKQPVFSTASALPIYLASALLPLLWLLLKPQHYIQHRTAITVAVRMLRLLLQAGTLLTPSAAAPMAKIVVARTSGEPHRALGIMLVMPMAFYMGHALYLLPWQVAALFQLASTGVLLHWAWRFPCFLQLAEAHASTHAWLQHAGHACTRVQSYSALLGSAFGLMPYGEFSAAACTGVTALQSLQVFATLLCLLVVPVASSHELERWMKLRYEQRQGDQGHLDPTLTTQSSSYQQASHSPGHVEGSSSTSRWSGSSSSGAVASVRSIHTLSVGELDRLVGDAGERASGWGHGCMLGLVLLVGLPVLWLLAELIAEAFGANRACAAVLTAEH